MKVYDLVILGAGPAGITAAVYAARKQIDFLVVSLDLGGQAAWSGDIENYTGYQFISGPELALKFQEHMDSFGIKVNMPESAARISKKDKLVKVETDKNEYFSKTAVIATGKSPRFLNVEGEKEFKNRGVTYCATCDGPVFKNKSVVIVGGGNSALDAALQMVRIASRVYVVNIAGSLTGDSVMIEKVKESSNVEIWNNSKIVKIYGDTFVRGVEAQKEGSLYKIDAEGVLIEAGLVPNSNFAGELKRNESEEIIVDCVNHTNIDGIFAAGDVTNVIEKQIIIACGEGAKACLSAFKYLSTHKFSVL